MNPTFPAAQSEGVIQFDLIYQAGPSPQASLVDELSLWRALFHRLGLTGFDPLRYDGLAFGNFSRRMAGNAFVVSGTQTGKRPKLTPNDYCLVTGFNLAANRIMATGPIRPSSEALTHAAMYSADRRIGWVFHVHAPEIWENAQCLVIPATPESVCYGTQAMAVAVQPLIHAAGTGVISMQGHRDGLIAYGPTAEATATCLLRSLALALELQNP